VLARDFLLKFGNKTEIYIYRIAKKCDWSVPQHFLGLEILSLAKILADFPYRKNIKKCVSKLAMRTIARKVRIQPK
jgi:hypothetical protein